MDKTTEIVLSLAIIFMTGLLFGKIAKKLRIPSVTGYLLGGLIVGPVLWTLFNVPFEGLVREQMISALSIFADIELAFIAFTVGSEFKISYFKHVGLKPVIIAFAESFGALLIITLGMLALGFPLYFALALGGIGGATAPAATILVIKQYKAKGPLTSMLMSVVAIDDASALIFFGIAMAVVRTLINPLAGAAWVSVVMPFIEIFGSVIMGAAIGFILTFFVKFFHSRGNRLVTVMAALFINVALSRFFAELPFTMGGSAVEIELSSLLACMVTGAVFTNMSPIVDDVMPVVDAITPPFVILFFVLSGADLKLGTLSGMAILAVFGYFFLRIAGKLGGTALSAKLTKAEPVIQKYLGYGLMPQGGVAIGLSMIAMVDLNAVGANIIGEYNGDFIRVVVLCAVFLSELSGPLLSKFALIKSGEGKEPPKTPKQKKLKVAAVEPPKK